MPGFVHGAVDDVEPVLEGGDSDGGGSGGGGGSGSGGSALRPLLPDADEWDVYVAVADVRPGRAAPAAAVVSLLRAVGGSLRGDEVHGRGCMQGHLTACKPCMPAMHARPPRKCMMTTARAPSAHATLS